MDGTCYGGLPDALSMIKLSPSAGPWPSHQTLKSLSGFQLPEPTYAPPNRSKKSHARKRPAGHIPRPRNAFILFRCDFVRQKKIPESVENDHRNISRIVGKIWQQMTPFEREPWTQMAEMEKVDHFRKHPGYSFSSGVLSTRKKIKRGDDVPHETQEEDTALDEALFLALQRANSCPPGTLRVPQVNLECLNGYGAPLKIRDDPPRRPSRVTLYQSTPCTASPESRSYIYDFADQNYHMVALKDGTSIAVHENRPGFEFAGPRLKAARYPIPDHTEDSFSGWFDPAFLPPSIKSEDQAPLLSSVFVDPFLSTLPPLPQSFSFSATPSFGPLPGYQGLYREEDARSDLTEESQLHFSYGDLQRVSEHQAANYQGRISDDIIHSPLESYSDRH